MIEAANLLIIGSTARNSGKTTLAIELAHQLAGEASIVALKITRVSDDVGCPHGDRGCGLCENFEGDFCLERETGISKGKDTSLLLESGLEQVYWLRSRDEVLVDGYKAFVNEVGSNCLIVVESNSLRKYVEPLLFVMIVSNYNEVKQSAQAVMEQADFIVRSDDIFERREEIVQKIVEKVQRNREKLSNHL